jgi:hydroxymethylpyrimidine kinase/phosphomethylpyrimidine kinase
LTIAGSDPSGGAGIQADLKTFAAHGVYGFSAVTAVTAQNSQGVRLVSPVPADVLSAQIDAVADDFDVHAVKIGMLATTANADAVHRALARLELGPVVLDPVLLSTSGARLLEPAGLDALCALMPAVRVVTPNFSEAAALTGRPIATQDEARDAAVMLVDFGAGAVVITGGDLRGRPVDLVYAGGEFVELEGDRVDTRHTHGTGCTFSAALAARLALGDDVVSAARAAKAYVTRALQAAPGLGHGRGPLGHL